VNSRSIKKVVREIADEEEAEEEDIEVEG